MFSSGPVGDPSDDDPAWTEPRRILDKVEELGARDHVVFGGALPAEPRGIMAKAMADEIPPEFRDRRDWDSIRSWAEGIGSNLRG